LILEEAVQDDFDLEGLSVAEAKAYVAEFITSLKTASQQREACENELDMWKKRVRLATEKGETDLARTALARAEETHAKLVTLKKEERELDFKVTELKRRLGNLRQQPQLTVNAEALLGQLESVVGTDHETRDALTDAEAEVALEELRRKMADEHGNSEKEPSENES